MLTSLCKLSRDSERVSGNCHDLDPLALVRIYADLLCSGGQLFALTAELFALTTVVIHPLGCVVHLLCLNKHSNRLATGNNRVYALF